VEESLNFVSECRLIIVVKLDCRWEYASQMSVV